MRWAFWRRSRTAVRAGSVGSEDAPGTLRTPESSPAARRDDPDEEPRRAAPAFSGASPQPGEGPPAPASAAGGDQLRRQLIEVDPSLDVAGVRRDLLALVQAALARDAAAAAEVPRRLEARGHDAPGTAVVAALVAFGDRCLVAADLTPQELRAGGAAAALLVAQGDTLAARAEPLLRAVVPQATRALVAAAVRTACGVPDQPPADAPQEDLLLVAAVLLAQTVGDGGGDTDALAGEVAELLPG